MRLDAPTAFRNRTRKPARYVVVIATERARAGQGDDRAAGRARPPSRSARGTRHRRALRRADRLRRRRGVRELRATDVAREGGSFLARRCRRASRAASAMVLAAEDETGIVGTVQVIWAEPENQPHRGDLAKMLVHRRARRRGIGAALLEAAERAARDAGKTLLVLDTASDRRGAAVRTARLAARRGRSPATRCYRTARRARPDVLQDTRRMTRLGGPRADRPLHLRCPRGCDPRDPQRRNRTSTALFDYEPRSPESMIEWFRAKKSHTYPVIGARGADGTLLGFATYGAFRAGPPTSTRSSTPSTYTANTAGGASGARSCRG